jgi:hypothetical protein
MTYPDLVPATSGFTGWFFIDVFKRGILMGKRTRSHQKLRFSIQDILEKSRRGDPLFIRISMMALVPKSRMIIILFAG